MELYNINAVYSDYVYPVEFVKIVELNLTDFEMWYLMSNEQIDITIGYNDNTIFSGQFDNVLEIKKSNDVLLVDIEGQKTGYNSLD